MWWSAKATSLVPDIRKSPGVAVRRKHNFPVRAFSTLSEGALASELSRRLCYSTTATRGTGVGPGGFASFDGAKEERITKVWEIVDVFRHRAGQRRWLI